jgi:hypothetical protein
LGFVMSLLAVFAMLQVAGAAGYALSRFCPLHRGIGSDRVARLDR